MPVPRLDVHNTGLLLLDVQDQIVPHLIDGPRLITNCAVLMRVADTLKLPYVVTELDPRRQGRTAQALESCMPDPSNRIERSSLSAYVDLVEDELDEWHRPTMLLAGALAHITVLQTALDMLADGVQVFVCRDAVSSNPMEMVEPALRRIERAGGVITDVQGAILELVGDLRHPLYGACATHIDDIAH
ncbi:MAG: isochorismatase family protein [Planctomycetota bacterium]